jgi:hypothetical protein
MENFVTYTSKYSCMKKLIIATVMVAGMAGIAFASLHSNKKRPGVENKVEKKQKRECKHTCPFANI